MTSDDWQLKYGREKAQVVVYMQMIVALVRSGAITSEEGQTWVKKANAAADNVCPEDFVRLAPLKPKAGSKHDE